jgi:putative ABC transport system substrate-binding protein
MTRRRIRLLITLALALLVAPLATAAPPAETVYRIGYLGTTPLPAHLWDALLEGLRERGYHEGRNLVFEHRFSEGHTERFPEFAAEMVRLKVDLILVSTTPAAIAATHATLTIPIVIPTAIDPVGAGLVASLARPGGNVTGLSESSPDLVGKRLELLKDVVPGLSRVVVLWNAANAANASAWQETQAAAWALGLRLHSQDVQGPQDLEGAFALTAQPRPDALLVLSDALISMHRQHIAAFATQHRLPAMYGRRDYVEAGGLMSYGVDFRDHFHRAAAYVDKILKGAKPGDLAVEQAARFELVINLKTAKALGINIPQSLLQRADEVIQ